MAVAITESVFFAVEAASVPAELLPHAAKRLKADAEMSSLSAWFIL